MRTTRDRRAISRARRESIRRRLPSRRLNPFLDDLRATWSRAFSLIEVLIVTMLIGTIAAIVVPSYAEALDKARVAHAIGDIAAMSEDISLFWFDKGRYPDNLAEAGWPDMLDPYGEAYVYLNIADNVKGKGKGATGGRKDRFLVPVNSDFDLYSKGKDKDSVLPFTAQPSHDDIVRANNGGFIGLAEDF